MTAPKHLWSGEWEQESEAAARGRERRLAATDAPQAAPDQPEPTPAARPVRLPAPWLSALARRLAVLARRLAGARPSRVQTRTGLIVLAVVAIVVAGAYGLGRLVGPGASTPAAVSGTPGWIGVRLGVLPTGAVVITGVSSGGPAASAGLRSGDVITQIERRPVAAPVDVTEAIAALQAGDSVEIEALRRSATLTIRVKLSAKPAGSP